MAVGLLFALTVPGVVVLLVAVALVEHLASRNGRRGVVSRTRRRALSAGGLDVFSSALIPGREVDLEAQRTRQIIADDVDQGGPPRHCIDRGRGIAYLGPRANAEPAGSGPAPRGQTAGGAPRSLTTAAR